MNLITIKEYTSAPGAYIDKGLLEENGIPAIINGEYASGVYPGVAIFATVTLAVNQIDELQAKELLGIEPRQ